MQIVPSLVVCCILWAGCSDAETSWTGSPQGELSIATWNVAQLTSGTEDVAEALEDLQADIWLLQECFDCEPLFDCVSEHRSIHTSTSGLAIGVMGDAFTVGQVGEIPLGQNDDGWGPRHAIWAQLSRASDGRDFLVYNTHFCVSIRNDSDLCDDQQQVSYVDAIVEHLAPNSDTTIPIVGGDFNIFGDYDTVTAPIRAAGLVDSFATLHPEDPATTFAGNDWAPAAKIDFIWVPDEVDIAASSIIQQAASDHNSVLSTISY